MSGVPVDSKSSSPVAVSCKEITKSFYAAGSKIPVLRGIDLSIQEGELFMLVGPSGCGKTTLISVIAGILQSDTGSCSVAGKEWKSMGANALAEHRSKSVGFVFQQYNLLPALTVAENISVPLVLQGIGRSKALAKAKEMGAKVGLERFLQLRPNRLSGGQQQRVAIARSLVHEPKLLVCDEPTSALDHDTGTQIMQLLRSTALEATGRCVVVVTHDTRIFNFADRIAFMDDGHIERIEVAASVVHSQHSTHH
ncbi:MAG: ABC transporter ATP-binding protein [Candidatus Sumerlaeia bacterium]|nr:ABC transporter ATP-binding protein [Candidatus Sumerlaeia bacterium]